MEFHISRTARDRYQFNESLFSLSGNAVFANFHAARAFVQKINAQRDLIRFPESAVRAGQINAMGLIDEILHLVAGLYREQFNPTVWKEALNSLDEDLGAVHVNQALERFGDEFPPLSVYQRDTDLKTYMGDYTEGRPNREIMLEEMLLLWLANSNPAFSPYRELFDASKLEKTTQYLALINSLKEFFEPQPLFGPQNQNLIDMLRSPAIAVPHSLPGQLEYIRIHWGYLLGRYLYQILGSLDLIKEEERATFTGPGASVVYEYGQQLAEPERFSPDLDWMPRVVLMAKNAPVWLDQLSKKYQRHIYRLDQIPDEEIDRLRDWGFSALWLIGVWERSPASRKIKQLCGNPDADASAYSLLDYRIAENLGGEGALHALRQRAWDRGIRLASDMVPNHVGIDSRWVIEHPDWFISQAYSPFPAYRFSGPDLSWDDQVSIFLEDHYYDRSDAAVVFQRLDRTTGDIRYIYHGNDGTSYPWNDTAQLNFLNPEVREAVIQTILHVARMFPIIRFDAAMTLAKKHYQRLWFPEPGSGGAIPSRADHGMDKAQFDSLMPLEFWREVVDRVAQEAPDTLLLAEAFWLMEGYFVRTLGMHRVYNSAFMNMTRDEDNAKYRSVMKNTLEFDPEILKRFVNFMNNPDERTAVDQFGKGDKYFGICTMMSTLPGLPMFGHGQVEGFTEKYGMEYSRAYWEEEPDAHLITRHQREIFPLLHRRQIFANVKDFLLYDFFTPEGFVNEDVFAYSNYWGDRQALVVYHNKFSDTQGWIRSSVAYAQKGNESTVRTLIQKSLGEGLELPADPDAFVAFRDLRTGLEYLRSCQEIHEKGLFIQLGAYQNHVFLDFRVLQDNEWHHYCQLNDYLGGRGVPSIEEALHEIVLRPILNPFRALMNAEEIHWLLDHYGVDESHQPETVTSHYLPKLNELLWEIKRFIYSQTDPTRVSQRIQEKLNTFILLCAVDENPVIPRTEAGLEISRFLQTKLDRNPATAGIALAWLFVHDLGQMASSSDPGEQSRSWVDEWMLGKVISGALQDVGMDRAAAWNGALITKLLCSQHNWHKGILAESDPAYHNMEAWLRDPEFQSYLQINRYLDTLYFNKDHFEEILWWLFTCALIDLASENAEMTVTAHAKLTTCFQTVETLRQAASDVGYQLEPFLDSLKERATQKQP